jgi:hypothetical protein
MDAAPNIVSNKRIDLSVSTIGNRLLRQSTLTPHSTANRSTEEPKKVQRRVETFLAYLEADSEFFRQNAPRRLPQFCPEGKAKAKSRSLWPSITWNRNANTGSFCSDAFALQK